MQSQIINIQLVAKILEAAEISDIVISPGSRNAALAMQFTQNSYFKCYSIVDERSAGFMALGMAQQTQKSVVLSCTSGSAVANYYPAITEAFYQNIPLLVITADRPKAFVDNFDGQTIRQKNIFEQHSYGNFELLEEETDEAIAENFQIIKKAIEVSLHNKGPVHLNIPLQEPLYNTTEEDLISIDKITIKEREFENILQQTLHYNSKEEKLSTFNFQKLQQIWKQSTKKLILCGVLHPSEDVQNILEKFAEDENVVILAETTSNLHHKNIFSSIDKLVFSMNEENFKAFAPDILLTMGQNVVSKKIKTLLRTSKIKEHWHLDEYWQPDTYFHLSEKIIQPKKQFLEALYQEEKPSAYFQSWKELQLQKEEKYTEFLQKTTFSDLKVYEFLSKKLPENSDIHFGNSSAIRYAQFFDFNSQHKFFCNRGTSGIEGSTSTAIGSCISTQKQTFLVTGDISFFYEINALWNENIPENFKIILVNNGGGEIFNFIPGPEKLVQKDTFLVTKHRRNAKNMAHEFQFNYFYCQDAASLASQFLAFKASPQKSILEINTAEIENSQVLKDFFKSV